MRYKKVIIIITVLFLIINPIILLKASNDNDENNAIQEEADYYSVIIGITQYKNGDGHETKDASAFYSTLLKSDNFWKAENMRFLLNENATKNKIIENISWLAQNTDIDDTIIFYFSGWGDYKYPQGYIRPYDGEAGDYNNLISESELIDAFENVAAKKIVFIFESCWSGKMKNLAELEGRAVLAAGGKFFWCYATYDPSIGWGLFTLHLINGLNGNADKSIKGNKDNLVSAKEAFNYARPRTMIHSFIVNLLDPWSLPIGQLPTLYYNSNEPIPLVYY